MSCYAIRRMWYMCMVYGLQAHTEAVGVMLVRVLLTSILPPTLSLLWNAYVMPNILYAIAMLQARSAGLG